MGEALLHGDIGAAWNFNPYVFSVGVVLAAVWMWTAVRVWLGRPAGLPGPLAIVESWSPTGIVLALVLPGIVFMVLRNLL
jgi:hypothetical protein